MGDMMQLTKTIAAAALGLALSAGSALAWGDIYMGDGTPKQPLVYAYGGENYCPAGLQPVVAGGEICCGVPNTTSYGNYTPKPRAKAHAPRRVVQKRGPRAYAVEGEKGVIYK